MVRASILGYVCIRGMRGLIQPDTSKDPILWNKFLFLGSGWGLLSFLWSLSPSTSRSTFLDFFLYCVLYDLINQSYFSKHLIKRICQFLVIIAVLVSLDGLFQKFYRYPAYLPYLTEYAQEFDPFTLEMMKNRVADLSGRIFSHFLLPSHLAGYLILIIPVNWALIRLTPTLWKRIGWILALGVNFIGLFLTKSYGAWLSLLFALTLTLSYSFLGSPAGSFLNLKKESFLPLFKPTGIDKKGILKKAVNLMVFCLGIFMVLTLIGYSRGIYLWDLNDPRHPAYLRLLNWKSALSILMDYPWTGAGLGTFKIIYPQYMLPGANEANFVHNSYLQIGSELGLPGLLAICYAAGVWILRGLTRLTALGDGDNRILVQGLFLAGLCFCFHNLMDYDLYVPSLGLMGFMLLGLGGNRSVGGWGCRRMEVWEGGRMGGSSTDLHPPIPPHSHPPILPPSHTSIPLYILHLSLVGLSLYLFTVNTQLYLTRGYLQQIKESWEQKDLGKAYETAQKALFYNPKSPSLQEISGVLLLELKRPEEATQAFQKAIELDPRVPRFHAYLAEAYLLKGDLAGAYVETKRAVELFPLRISYQKKLEEVTALLEKYSIRN
ncbi:MAG TPA: O-antigen ligase family protein [Candidatus Limnocylindrales bacterium]|nr:O-antigen ligase family protein [Candidatus Limnocylindrales bacterium]